MITIIFFILSVALSIYHIFKYEKFRSKYINRYNVSEMIITDENELDDNLRKEFLNLNRIRKVRDAFLVIVFLSAIYTVFIH